jgi:glycosyltransferase involved in cell wall biosynthesis
VYVGFEANDFFNPETPRQKKFLHLAGGSSTKNTAAVVSAWRFPYSLTVVSYGAEVRVPRNVPNVRVTARIPESEVHQLLNECQYHIMPSMYEGYGHSLHESIGCGAVIITTDAPPMNEFIGIDKNLLVPVLRRDPCRLGHLNWVSPDSVAVAVQRALEMTDDQIKAASQAARDGFVQDRDFFRSEFANIVQAASERVNKNQVLPMPPLPPQSPQSPQPPQSPQRVRRVYTNNGLTIDWWSRHPRA